MTRTSERSTVTSEAIPDVALTLPASSGYHGTAPSQYRPGMNCAPRSGDVHAHPVRAFLAARVCASAPGP